MTDASRQESGSRLADDLRRIRESKTLSVQDLNNETKIPVSLLTAFEKTALFDHSQFNRVYLRSFVRTYASAVGISAEQAAEALDAAFEGSYDGDLGREHLGDPPAEPRPVSTTPRLAEERPSVSRRRPREEEPPKERRSPPPLQAKRDPNAEWTSTSPPSRRVPAEREPSAPRVRAKRRRSSGRGAAGWIFALAGVVVLGALIWFLVSILGDGERAQREPIVAADTAAATVAEPQPEPVTRPAVTLGDVISFYVVAESDKLDPIRVTVDDDLRRPFWLEQGDSLQFEAQERIVFEELLDRARITVEGYNWPMDRRDEQGRLVITREDARAYFDGGETTLE